MLAVTAAGVAAYWRADPRRVRTLGLVTQRLYTKPRELTALEQVVRAGGRLAAVHALTRASLRPTGANVCC